MPRSSWYRERRSLIQNFVDPRGELRVRNIHAQLLHPLQRPLVAVLSFQLAQLVLNRSADELSQWNLQLGGSSAHFIGQGLRERNLILNAHWIIIHIHVSLYRKRLACDRPSKMVCSSAK